MFNYRYMHINTCPKIGKHAKISEFLQIFFFLESYYNLKIGVSAWMNTVTAIKYKIKYKMTIKKGSKYTIHFINSNYEKRERVISQYI